MKRRCLCGCGQLVDGSRCTTSRKQLRAKYSGDWTQEAKRAVATHVATYGNVCPGDQHHSAHPSTDLTVDHDIGVICRAGNSAKRNRGDG